MSLRSEFHNDQDRFVEIPDRSRGNERKEEAINSLYLPMLGIIYIKQ